MELGPWNWLEIAKLGSGLLMPAALAIFGIYIHRVTKRFEHFQWQSQQLIGKRLTIYDDIAPLLNDLLCYFTYVGCWRDLDPPAVVSMKRVLDKKIYIASPLFTEEWFKSCQNFQNFCFETYTGWGRDASLRTHSDRRQQARANDWNSDWDTYFSRNVPNPDDIRAAYSRVMEAFTRDIGIHSTFVVPQSGRVPSNIR